MKYLWIGLAVAIAAGAVLVYLHLRSRFGTRGPVAHVENAFDFTVAAPLARVAPLFGAWEERGWAGDEWDPQFVYPQPPRDIEGEVFTVAHGHGRSVWVNTALDLENGHMQYVYTIPGVQVARIDVRARQVNAAATSVHVVYERTSLDAGFNSQVTEMGRHDARSGPEWQAQIEKYFAGQAR